MRHLKTYRVFESQGVTLDSKQTEWLGWVCSAGWQMGRTAGLTCWEMLISPKVRVEVREAHT